MAEDLDRPPILMFVSFPVTDTIWTDPALVDLETAAELQVRGWICVGPCPASVAKLDEWLAAKQWLKRIA